MLIISPHTVYFILSLENDVMAASKRSVKLFSLIFMLNVYQSKFTLIQAQEIVKNAQSYTRSNLLADQIFCYHYVLFKVSVIFYIYVNLFM